MCIRDRPRTARRIVSGTEQRLFVGRLDNQQAGRIDAQSRQTFAMERHAAGQSGTATEQHGRATPPGLRRGKGKAQRRRPVIHTGVDFVQLPLCERGGGPLARRARRKESVICLSLIHI